LNAGQGVAILTGAGRGIGRATAVELARAGYRLVLAARSEDQLRESARLAGDGLIVATDVSKPEAVESLVQRTVEVFGRIDAIVNSVGMAPVQSIAEMSPAQWRNVIDVNLSAAFYLCHYAWPVFERQGGGVVVNVSSMASRDPFAGFAAYGAAKAGLNLLGLSAAREGERIGVRVHTVAPGAVETDMFRQIATPQQWPAEKTLDPGDVARVIVQCVKGDLRYTSGEVIFVRRTMG
jgi:NAD(P)-dependent dehydrogenase (short-subunit alcohol dehydrogenase family)